MKKYLLLLFFLPVVVLGQKKVAITIDDLPYAGPGNHSIGNMQAVNDTLLAQLKERRIKAVGFVNEGKIERNGETEEKLAILQAWLTAGQELGNHTYSHLKLFNTPLDKYQEDVLKGEILTKRLLKENGQSLRYFRPPYMNTGSSLEVKSAFEKFLKTHRYQLVPHTAEGSDWLLNAVYAKAKGKGDSVTMKLVSDAYITYTVRMFDFFEGKAQQLFGRSIPQIYLCHMNELQADCFGMLADRLKEKGYVFISLEEALEDQVYSLDDTYVGKFGPSWLHRWNLFEPMEELLQQEPVLDKHIYELYKSYE